jgi:hypothetical protein
MLVCFNRLPHFILRLFILVVCLLTKRTGINLLVRDVRARRTRGVLLLSMMVHHTASAADVGAAQRPSLVMGAWIRMMNIGDNWTLGASTAGPELSQCPK